MDVRDKFFLGGKWVDPAGAESYDVISPSTEEALYLMVQSYDKLELPTLRDGADRVLRANFPQSKYIAGNSAAGPRSWWQIW